MSEPPDKKTRGQLKRRVTTQIHNLAALRGDAETAKETIENHLKKLQDRFNELEAYHQTLHAKLEGNEKLVSDAYWDEIKAEYEEAVEKSRDWLACKDTGNDYTPDEEETDALDTSMMSNFQKYVAKTDGRLEEVFELLNTLKISIDRTSADAESAVRQTSTPYKAPASGSKVPVVTFGSGGLSRIEEEESPAEASGNPEESTKAGGADALDSTRDVIQQMATSFTEGIKEILKDRKKEDEAVAEVYKVPKFKLFPFSGEHIDYLPFMKAFETQVEAKVKDPATLLGVLIHHTKGTLQNTLRSFTLRSTPSAGYSAAREYLKDTYGRYEDVVQAWMDKFYEQGSIDTLEGLKDISAQLNSCYEALRAVNQLNEFETKSNLYTIVAKLPQALRVRWQQWVVDIEEEKKKKAGLFDLIKFCNRIYRERSDPVYGSNLDGTETVGKKAKHAKGGTKNNKLVMAIHEGSESSSKSAEFSNNVNHVDQVSGQGNQRSHGRNKKERSGGRPQFQCAVCSENHGLFKCEKFIAMSVKDRNKLVLDSGSCVNCFHPKHFASECRSNHRCRVCNRKHHTLLHFDRQTGEKEADGNEQNVNTVVKEDARHTVEEYVNTVLMSSKVALPVVSVWVKGKTTWLKTLALLDGGSTCTLCTDDLLDRLEVPFDMGESSMTTIEGRGTRSPCRITRFCVKGATESKEYQLRRVYAKATLNLSASCRATPYEVERWPHLEGIPVPDADLSEVTILIGRDHPRFFIHEDARYGESEVDPCAILTCLGWYISGPMDTCVNGEVSELSSHAILHDDEQLQEACEKFWSIDDVSNCSSNVQVSQKDKEVNSLWEREIHYDGRQFHLPIPFKKEPPYEDEETNRPLAVQRLRSLGRRMKKDPVFGQKYTKGIKKYFTKKPGQARPFAERAYGKGRKGYTNYLSHHCVFHPRKPDDPRVVFDAKSKWKGISLNDLVHSGPDLMNKLLDILLRFRSDEVLVGGDVEGMFNMILVILGHRDCMRFLWFKDDDPDGEIIEYRMTTHVFGGIWSPSCANFTLKHTANTFGEDYDEDVKRVVQEEFYVDDGWTAESTEEQAARVGNQVRELLARGGFNFTKMFSNKEAVMRALPSEALMPGAFQILRDGLALHVLGCMWIPKYDVLVYHEELADKPSTKRGVLGTMCALYDPLGLAQPVIIKAKIIFQDCCREKLGWDQELTEELSARWEEWKVEMEALGELRFRRCFLPEGYTLAHPGLELELHVFCDSSQKAYGGVVYVRSLVDKVPVGCNLAMAKGRLAPLKQLSIPKLELTAAQTGTQMYVCMEGASKFKVSRAVMWTDSMIVYCNIQNEEKRHPVFEANRLGYIAEHTSKTDWRHVPTALNPADIVSRGASPEELAQSDLWLHGPEFLMQTEEHWPQTPSVTATVMTAMLDDLKRPVKEKLVFYGPEEKPPPPMKIEHYERLIERYNSWYKVKKALAYVIRCMVWWHHKKKFTDEYPRRLTVQDLRRAETALVKYVQREIRWGERQTRLRYAKLYPIDVDGIVRVGGRLARAEVHHDKKHPVVIPAGRMAEGIIWDAHKRTAHGGGHRTLHEVQSEFWVIKARRQIRRILGACLICKKLKASFLTPLMQELPANRVRGGEPPFTYSGIDYFGPLIVKSGRTEKKRYGCLMTCYQTRAVHLEVAYSLDQESCMNAITRFIARRGEPKEIDSDNGKNFVGANKVFVASTKSWNLSEWGEYFLRKGIKWRFNPPAASHMGGVWERQIRTVRQILMVLINGQTVTDESLHTLMCVTEDIVNSRPITAVSRDATDLCAITPNQLLRPNTRVYLPPGIFDSTDKYRSHWKQVQYLAAQFWIRWKAEYLPALQPRGKWTKDERSLMVGDLILLKDEHTPRNVWPLGRVVSVQADSKGVVRSADVKTYKGTYRRPVHKMCLLEGVGE